MPKKGKNKLDALEAGCMHELVMQPITQNVIPTATASSYLGAFL